MNLVPGPGRLFDDRGPPRFPEVGLRQGPISRSAGRSLTSTLRHAGAPFLRARPYIFKAEKRALDYAEGYKSVLQALSFLVSWPALDGAASVVIGRAVELNGDYFEILIPAADARWQAPARRYPGAEVDDRFRAR